MENIIEDLDNFMEREVYILLNSEQRTILEEKYEDFKRSNEMEIEELDYNQFVQDEERKIELLCIESSIHEQSSIESSILLCSTVEVRKEFSVIHLNKNYLKLVHCFDL